MVRRETQAVKEKASLAFSLLRIDWVREYLLHPNDGFDARIITNTRSRQNAVAMEVFQRIYDRTGKTGGSFDVETNSQWLCIPAYTRGFFTVGVVVENLVFRATGNAVASRPYGHTMMRFAADGTTAQWICITERDAKGFAEVHQVQLHSLGNRSHWYTLCNLDELERAIVENRDMDEDTLRRTFLYSFGQDISRFCENCAAHPPSKCMCPFDISVPKHSADFVPFVKTMKLAFGDFDGVSDYGVCVMKNSIPVYSGRMVESATTREWLDKGAANSLMRWAIDERVSKLVPNVAGLQVPMAHLSGPELLMFGFPFATKQIEFIDDHGTMTADITQDRNSSSSITHSDDSEVFPASVTPVDIPFSQMQLTRPIPPVPSKIGNTAIESSQSAVVPAEPRRRETKQPVVRAAPRIEKNPFVVITKQPEYLGKRDIKLLERKQRNRESAARSNQRRKEQSENLKSAVLKSRERVKELQEIERQLLLENKRLKLMFGCQDPSMCISEALPNTTNKS